MKVKTLGKRPGRAVVNLDEGANPLRHVGRTQARQGALPGHIDGDGANECAGSPFPNDVRPAPACLNSSCSGSTPVCEVAAASNLATCGEYGLCQVNGEPAAHQAARRGICRSRALGPEMTSPSSWCSWGAMPEPRIGPSYIFEIKRFLCLATSVISS